MGRSAEGESQKTCLDDFRTVFGVETLCGLYSFLIPGLVSRRPGIFAWCELLYDEHRNCFVSGRNMDSSGGDKLHHA